MSDAFQIDATDLNRLATNMAGGPAVVRTEMVSIVTAVGLEAEANAKGIAPVDRGQLRRSITSVTTQTATGAQARVGTGLDLGSGSDQYARAIEFGRRPGAPMPPVAAIAGWLKRRGSTASPYVVARSIARKGTRAQPYLLPGVERAVAQSGRHVQAAVQRIIAQLGGGS